MDTLPPAHPRDTGYYPQDPIAALATPWGESALAVIRLSGPHTLELLARAFRGTADLRRAEGYTLHYGFLEDPAAGERIDQVLVAVYRAPRSYTGEEGAEVTCHGSPVVVRRLLALLRSAGFRFAEPGEFTLRAFLNGKVDLTRAEAVNELIRARTDRARALAFSRLSGSIESRIRRIRDGLVGLAAGVELSLDYPEEESEEAPPPLSAADRWIGELERLLATYRIGRIIQEGLAVVIAGRTNAGKSTLFNRLLREDRAIVSETHGTTRDYLEGTIAVDGIPLRIYDTAGLRAAAGPLEREGMRRTDRLARSADLVLYLVDAGAGVRPDDEEFLAALAGAGPAVDGRESGGPSHAEAEGVSVPSEAVGPASEASGASGARGFCEAEPDGTGVPPGSAGGRGAAGRLRLPIAGAMQKPEASAKKNRGAVLQEGGSGRLIRLWTKIDRCPAAAPEGFLPLSAERGDGMEELGRRMAEAALGGASPPGGEAVIDSLRQKELLERARRALAGFRAGLAEGVPYDLLSVDLKEALDALGEITGEVTTADILERMFRDFCVGK